MVVLSLSSIIQKGGILFNYNSGNKIFLTQEGKNIIDKLEIFQGNLHKFNKEERGFLNSLKEENFLQYSKNFKKIKKIDDNCLDSIQWEISRKCNLSCSYCFLNKYENISESSLDLTFDKILNNPSLEVIITGGEPLLLKDKLKEYIIKLRKNKRKIKIYTNGTLIDENWINFFKKHKIHIFLGIDVIKNIRNEYKIMNLKLINLLKSNEIELTLNLVISKENIKDIKMINKLAKSLNLPVRQSLLIGENDKKLSVDEYIELIENTKYIPNVDENGCGAGKNQTYIRSDGQILPCALFNNKEFKFSNKTNSNFYKIQKITTSKYPTMSLEFCKNCNIKFICNSGCRARAYFNNKDIYSKDEVRCDYEKILLNRFLVKYTYNKMKECFENEYKNRVSKIFYKKALQDVIMKFNNFYYDNFILVELIDNKVVGFLFFKFVEKENKKLADLSFIYVDKEFRRNRVGTSLIKKFEEICKLNKCDKIFFGALEKESNFYKKLNYRVKQISYNLNTPMTFLEKEL